MAVVPDLPVPRIMIFIGSNLEKIFGEYRSDNSPLSTGCTADAEDLLRNLLGRDRRGVAQDFLKTGNALSHLSQSDPRVPVAVEFRRGVAARPVSFRPLDQQTASRPNNAGHAAEPRR